jgi:hypothetical protein
MMLIALQGSVSRRGTHPRLDKEPKTKLAMDNSHASSAIKLITKCGNAMLMMHLSCVIRTTLADN